MLKPIVLLAGLVLALAGCTNSWNPVDSQTAGYAVIDGVSLVNTDKSVIDHGYSLLTGKDCSIVRKQLEGVYCIDPDEEPVLVDTKLYCYRTLANVSCYRKPLAGAEMVGTPVIPAREAKP